MVLPDGARGADLRPGFPMPIALCSCYAVSGTEVGYVLPGDLHRRVQLHARPHSRALPFVRHSLPPSLPPSLPLSPFLLPSDGSSLFSLFFTSLLQTDLPRGGQACDSHRFFPGPGGGMGRHSSKTSARLRSYCSSMWSSSRSSASSRRKSTEMSALEPSTCNGQHLLLCCLARYGGVVPLVLLNKIRGAAFVANEPKKTKPGALPKRPCAKPGEKKGARQKALEAKEGDKVEADVSGRVMRCARC
eukprot:2771352-Rhodomonas_salina.2